MPQVNPLYGQVSPPVVTLLAIATIFLVPNPERGGADNANNSVQLTASQEFRASQNPIVQMAVETWTLLKTCVLLSSPYFISSHSSYSFDLEWKFFKLWQERCARI